MVDRLLSDDSELTIRSIVLNLAQKKGQIVQGTRALNPQLPIRLQRKTEDYDILTNNPKKSAKETAEYLKRYTSKTVELRPAKHKGTYRVIVNGKVVADYTQITRKIPTKKILGVKYVDIKQIKRGANKRVNISTKSFRREKDLDTLERIRQIESKFNI